MLLRSARVALGILLCFTAVSAQKTGSGIPEPVFDVRLLTAGGEAKEEARRVQAAAQDLVRAAWGSGADLRVSWGDHGRPRSVHRVGGVLGRPEASDPVAAAREFLTTYRNVLGLSPRDLEGFRVAGRTPIGRWTQVRLEQTAGGLPVWGGQVSVTLNQRGEVVQLLSDPIRPGLAVDPRTTLTASDAARLGLRMAGVRASDEALVPLQSPSGRWTLYRHPEASALPVAVSQAVFPLSTTEGRVAYRVYVDGPKGESYEMLLDARSGEALYRAPLARHATARIYPRSPLHGDRELVDIPAEWLDEGGLVTLGNRVDAFLDRDLDGEPDDEESPGLQGGRAFSETQEFDFESGEGLSGKNPRMFPAAAATNLFYHLNQTLDAFYELGFTEEAGNFQTSNFDHGGEGGDPVLASVQTSSGASFLPRPEGVSPRLRTGIGSNGTLAQTDDFDLAYSRQTIIHEMAHGLTGRLIGGPDRTDCLDTQISDSLAEGWSDYYAISFTNDPVLGAYDDFALPLSGIRRQSYEGYTFQHQDLGNEGFEVHNDGEIWAAVLWDVRKQLGQETTDMLVTDALPLTACDPTMVDAKDAVLLADEQRFEGANQAVLQEVFAHHGLGFSSSSIDGYPLAESITWNASFDLPPVEGENHNPVVTGRIPESSELGDDLVYPIAAEDADDDALTFTLLTGPPGLSVDPEGVVRWSIDRFAPQRVMVEITDGRGGRILHGFTTPVVTYFGPGEPLSLSAPAGDEGLLYAEIPDGLPLLQFRLRPASDDDGDADMLVFPLGATPETSTRDGSFETLSYAAPQGGRWPVRVYAFDSFDNVSLEAATPSVGTLEPGVILKDLSDVTSGETFYSITVPEGVETMTLSMGGGGGDADLYVAQGRLPICQSTFLVSQYCDVDDYSEFSGNLEQIVVSGPSEALTEAGQKLAVEPGEYFVNVAGAYAYQGAQLMALFETGQGAPKISRFGVTNGASFGYFAAPGTIATLFGTNLADETGAATETPLPRAINGVEVLVDGEPAPLYFVSAGQINFQVPVEVAPFTAPTVMVRRNGEISPFEDVLVLDNAPEIFRYERVAGSLEPVVVHADGALVTPENPAKAAETLVVYGTGLGQLENPPATGEPAAVSPLSTLLGTALAALGEQEITVLFAGLTPGFVGLAQFNVTLPETLPAEESSLPLLFYVDGYLSEDVEVWVDPTP
ncbi:MAG: hypothetical protein GC160_21410 [Acidobacteria bacterium]|nr:hypothetical protein [Acidobacteriota bacterium]